MSAAESFDDWELPETRKRERAGPGERAECCGDRVRFTAEIPRVAFRSGGRFEYPPARFRLCRHHADILRLSDPRARVFPVPDMKGSPIHA